MHFHGFFPKSFPYTSLWRTAEHKLYSFYRYIITMVLLASAICFFPLQKIQRQNPRQILTNFIYLFKEEQNQIPI